MYVYKRTEFSPYELYTVGFYEPNGNWIPESDHSNQSEAAERTILLNGGTSPLLKAENEKLKDANKELLEALKRMLSAETYQQEIEAAELGAKVLAKATITQQ